MNQARSTGHVAAHECRVLLVGKLDKHGNGIAVVPRWPSKSAETAMPVAAAMVVSTIFRTFDFG